MIRQVIATGKVGQAAFKLTTVERRNPEGTEVSVDVRASGINFYDIYASQGLSKDAKPPCTLGLECSGVVTAVGRDASKAKIGDHVLVYCPEGGTFTDFFIVDERNILVVPISLCFKESAAITVNYLTAHFSLCQIGNIQEGSSVFIQGVAGGVGWAATQLAKLHPGVLVIGTASQDKHAEAKKNGVDLCLSYEENIKEEILKYSPGGVDIIIESMAGKQFENCKDFLKPLGKLILIGAKNMIVGERRNLWSVFSTWWNTKNIDPTTLIMKNMCVAGLNLAEVFKKRPSDFHKEWEHIVHLLLEGKISPRIDSCFRFEEIHEAYQRIIQRKNIGKIILLNT